MVDILAWFVFAAMVIIIGYFGQVLFKKTSIADTVILMLVGLAIGPVFNLIDIPTIGFFKTVAPLFAALTLMILLFEGGLRLNFHKVISEVRAAFGFTVLGFLLTVILTTLLMFNLGWDPLVALMLATMLGGTSSAVIIPLVNSIKVKEQTRTILSLESALTDALCIIVTIAVIEVFMFQALELQMVIETILKSFSIAAVLGFIFAIYWLVILRDVNGVKEHDYILTIAVLFTLFALTEYAHANGAIAALVFGLVLGNAKEITTFLRMKPCELDTTIGIFHKEMSFFVRTFFFIYIGIIFELSSITLEIIGIGVGILALILIARAIASWLLVKLKEEIREDRSVLASMSARGLAAAVLASYPAIMGAEISVQSMLIQIAFLLILFSNIATTLGVFLSRKQRVEYTETGLEKVDLKEAEQKEKIAEIKLKTAMSEKEAEKAKKELDQSKEDWIKGVKSELSMANKRLKDAKWEEKKEKQA
ncbi:MAG: cation:proton antiporter [Candidatus Diapherotrites archaeon]|uniref:Cation:proton antiporter n=1 Tax=Candidatus Iainarchaeum sp. TaxID=3101447 RepID=A0A938YYR8_9ARCH|nr:cation:proton antiporter [Candidatus Diapherotrites archaeon]